MGSIASIAPRRAGRKLRALAGWCHALLAFTLIAPVSASAKQSPARIDSLALRTHTSILAADSMGGRGTGSPGEQKAAAYIASQLSGMGLTPLTGSSFLMPVPIKNAVIGNGTRLIVRRQADTLAFAHNIGFVVAQGGPTAFASFSGPAILAGTPAAAEHALRGTSMSGKVIVLLGPLGENDVNLTRAWHRGGVAGIVQLISDAEAIPQFAANLGAGRLFVDADVDDPHWQSPIPTVTAGPEAARAILQGARIPEAAFTGQPFDAVDLGRTVELQLQVNVQPLNTANVGAIIPGSDPQMRNEIVLYTAHFDHLGVGKLPDEPDSIFNGFSDNAAGVAMLLAIADALRKAPPPRSTAFLFLTGEERGLLGSSFVAANPPWPLNNVQAVINLDGGAPPRAPVSWRVAGPVDIPLGALADSIGRAHGWTINVTATRPNSDHWPFMVRGVPAALIIPGNEWENTTTEERDALRTIWNRYHHPDDEYQQSFPFEGLVRYAQYALELGVSVATRVPGIRGAAR